MSYATGTTEMMGVIAEYRAQQAGYGTPVVVAERVEEDDGSTRWRADGVDNWTLVWGGVVHIDPERACVIFTPTTMLGSPCIAVAVPVDELVDAITLVEFSREGRTRVFARPSDDGGPSTQRVQNRG